MPGHLECDQSIASSRPRGSLNAPLLPAFRSRSIGDFDVGEPVTCAPAILQVRVPESGCRIVLATDGLWDVDKGKDVPTVVGVRKLPTHAAAKKLVRWQHIGGAPVAPYRTAC